MASKALVVLALLASSLGTPVDDSPTTYQDFESNHIGSPTPTPYYTSLPDTVQLLNSPPPALQYSTYPTNTPQYSTYVTSPPPAEYSSYPTNSPAPHQYSTYATSPPTTHSKPTDDHDNKEENHNSLRPGSIVFTITAPYPQSTFSRFPFGRSPLGLNPQRFPYMAQRFPFLYRRGLGPRVAPIGYVASPPPQNIPVSSSNIPVAISFNPNAIPAPYPRSQQHYTYNPPQLVAPIVLEPIHLDLNKTTPFEYKFECRPNCLRTRSILPLSLNFRIGCYPIRICTRLLLIHSREPIRNASLARAGIRAAGNNSRSRPGHLAGALPRAG